jgi:thiol-disulfide isomerase/thioredoxin
MILTHTRVRAILLVLALSAIAAAQSVPAQPITVKSGAAQPARGAAAPTLRVGMPAPQLKVAKWFKGTPVERLETGKVYVVEFWATWCGPCRTSIPHVTELAKKYGDKVTVIGVSVWERPKEKTNEGIAALIEPFVKEMGDKMAYNVAADDPNGTMANTWMAAAGRTGIPSAFIVGKEGKIAWMGHPMEMDKTLEAVVAGTFNVAAEAAEQSKKSQEQQDLAGLVGPIKAAITAKDPNAIVKAVDTALAAKPDMESELMPVKLTALLQTDEVSAFAYLKASADKGFFEKNPAIAYTVAMVINQRADTMKKPDWPVLLGILEKVNESRQNRDWLLLASYAQILARTGQVDKAIEIQQKAVDLASPFAGTLASQAWIDAQKKRLDEYKSKKN